MTQPEDQPERETVELDVRDAEAYAAGALSLEEFNRRAIERHIDHVPPLRGSIDPVVVYDAMHEAGTSLDGSFVWMSRHTDDEAAAQRWRDAGIELHHSRERVDARDMELQRRVTREYIAREQTMRAVVRP